MWWATRCRASPILGRHLCPMPTSAGPAGRRRTCCKCSCDWAKRLWLRDPWCRRALSRHPSSTMPWHAAVCSTSSRLGGLRASSNPCSTKTSSPRRSGALLRPLHRQQLLLRCCAGHLSMLQTRRCRCQCRAARLCHCRCSALLQLHFRCSTGRALLPARRSALK